MAKAPNVLVFIFRVVAPPFIKTSELATRFVEQQFGLEGCDVVGRGVGLGDGRGVGAGVGCQIWVVGAAVGGREATTPTVFSVITSSDASSFVVTLSTP